MAVFKIRNAFIPVLFTVLLVNSGCASRDIHKGSAAERIEKFSPADESLEEKYMESSGAPEYIK